MTPQGLLLQFLPPFSVVARFFLTASIFGLLGSLLSLYLSLKQSFNLPAVIHVFTLGFMGMTMIGALFQMLPVVAGAVIEKPLRSAFVTHLALSLGVSLLIPGFLSGNSFLLLSGTLVLIFGIYYITFKMIYKLLKLESCTPTSRGMKYTVGNFMVGAFLAFLLILTLVGFLNFSYGDLLKKHLSFMLVGWVFLLIASVSFQVIEMFFVTPPYPKVFSWNLPPIVTVFLLLKLFLGSFLLLNAAISLLMISFAILTIDRLKKRRRKIPDPLVNLWNFGVIFLILSSLLYPFIDKSYKVFLFFLFSFGTFALSIILAMMYRIIPFLVWLHLTNMGVPNPPTMHEVINRREIYLNLRIHIISTVLFILSFFIGKSYLWFLCSLFYSFSFLILVFNLSRGILVYIRRKGSQQGVYPPPQQGQL